MILLEVAAIILPILGLVVFLSRNLETHKRLFVFILAVVLSAPVSVGVYTWIVLSHFVGHPQ